MDVFDARLLNDNSGEFYIIEITHLNTGTKWSEKKKLNDFFHLYDHLSESFEDVPLPPGHNRISGFMRVFSKSLPDMSEFVNYIFNDTLIISNYAFLDFINVSEHLPHLPLAKSIIKEEKETFAQIKYIEKGENFYLTAETDPSPMMRIESYMTLLGFDSCPSSRVRCFGTFGTWDLSIQDLITSMHYNPRLTILSVGLESGNVLFLRIKTEKSSSEYENFGFFQIHTSQVCGLASDYSNSKIFSCSITGQLMVTSLSTRELLLEIILTCAPNTLMLSEDLKTLFLPSDRQVYTYNLQTLKEKKAFEVDLQGFISCFYLCKNKTCVLGGFSGEVFVYDSDFVLIQKYQVVGSVNCLVFDEVFKVVFVGDSKGTVFVWDMAGYPVANWKAHDCVTALQSLAGNVVTAGSDKVLKTWGFEIRNR